MINHVATCWGKESNHGFLTNCTPSTTRIVPVIPCMCVSTNYPLGPAYHTQPCSRDTSWLIHLLTLYVTATTHRQPFVGKKLTFDANVPRRISDMHLYTDGSRTVDRKAGGGFNIFQAESKVKTGSFGKDRRAEPIDTGIIAIC